MYKNELGLIIGKHIFGNKVCALLLFTIRLRLTSQPFLYLVQLIPLGYQLEQHIPAPIIKNINN